MSYHIKKTTATQGPTPVISEHNRDTPLLDHEKQHVPWADPDSTEASLSTAGSPPDFTLGSLTSYPLLYLVCCVTLYRACTKPSEHVGSVIEFGILNLPYVNFGSWPDKGDNLCVHLHSVLVTHTHFFFIKGQHLNTNNQSSPIYEMSKDTHTAPKKIYKCPINTKRCLVSLITREM